MFDSGIVVDVRSKMRRELDFVSRFYSKLPQEYSMWKRGKRVSNRRKAKKRSRKVTNREGLTREVKEDPSQQSEKSKKEIPKSFTK